MNFEEIIKSDDNLYNFEINSNDFSGIILIIFSTNLYYDLNL